jgi:hypothetical protein
MDDIAIQVGNFTTAAAANSWGVVSNFLVLIGLSVLFILFSYRSRGGIISLIVAFYVGYAIFLVFPYTQNIVASGGDPLMKAGISVAIYFICCIIPFLFIERLASGGFGILSVLPRFGLSILAATFLMALAYHVFHVNNIYTFPEPMNTIFAPDQFFFWWFVAPLLGLLFLVH